MSKVLDEKTKQALKRLLEWITGFEDSPLYEDYKEYEHFTDEDYEEVLQILHKFLE